ncbi:class I SAM-dependent methyltransferase [Sulfitobacter aestuarii]|uniref:Class I SAM-dependent methyltransferase n=1 Tax=Sulfitobacter aestuarii TaxID=2161676 RepID=A0ABW5U117_9RHOB
MTDAGSDNAEQRQFWSEQAGDKWIARQAELDTLFDPVLEGVLARADLAAGQQVLDIGCGAGTSSLQAAERVGAQGHVLGVDISAPLVAHARARAEGHHNVSFAHEDAAVHPFEPAHFDRLISRFGVMFFADSTAAFRNIASALKAGAKISFAAWGQIDHNPYFTLPAQTARAVLGPRPKTDPDLPGPFAFRNPGRVEDILRKSGFTEIASEVVRIDLTPRGSSADLADQMCDIGPAHAALDHFSASAEQRAELRDALKEALSAHAWLDGLKILAEINFFTGTRG